MKYFRQFVSGLVLVLAFSDVLASENFITFKLPQDVLLDIPKNWTIISKNKRITLDTVVESTLDLSGTEAITSNLSFAANYYEDGITVGIVNLRYYPDMDLSQKDAASIVEADMPSIDLAIKESIIESFTDTGLKVLSWRGTRKEKLNGIIVLITSYSRQSLDKNGEFNVQLIRVFNNKKSFTLTISYLESKKLFMKNIVERMILSLKTK